MLLLGLDLGTSSVKVSVIDADTAKTIASAQYPETEREILSLQAGWAEQDPQQWWADTKKAIQKANAQLSYDPGAIKAIGIAYQMHGLVCVDQHQQVLRNSIIWCDSRAVSYGNKAFDAIGQQKCLSHLLNSPGNFTAAKLAWVKEHEPELYANIATIMLPGDYIAMMLTGSITTSISALSEGIFWDFANNEISKDVMGFFDFHSSIIPTVKEVFTSHGELSTAVATELGLTPGIPVTYKAGDQPNNALSLHVMEPGEVAATAGTSGVIYGITDQLAYDPLSRVNSFAHVNHTQELNRIGVLLCINGAGSMNRWSKQMAGQHLSYEQINEAAKLIAPGSNGLQLLPFGNGAERMLGNTTLGASMHHIDLNVHTQAHLFRASQEGVAFAFRYGLDIMKQNGMTPQVIRAGRTNMFLSDVFTEAFVNATNVTVELYPCDGSVGAAMGAGIGVGFYTSAHEAFSQVAPIALIEPKQAQLYNELYDQWKALLEAQL